MAQALEPRGEIKNRHCEGTEQALSLSPAEDKKKSDNYNINNNIALDITVKSKIYEKNICNKWKNVCSSI